MKLAEALLLRSEYQKKIDNLQQRIMINLKVQENEKPHEEPNVLLAEEMRVVEELKNIIKKINRKNAEIQLANGQTIAEALIERDMLMKKRQILSDISSYAGQRDFRLTHSEVKLYSTVDIGKIQKEIDLISKQFRQIDTQIQEKNWSVELE